MKIFHTVTITGNQHESHERADDATPMCCCDAMYNAWGEVIAFDPKQKAVDLQFYHPSVGETEFWGGDCLRFCPWCGQPIELECTGTEDKRTTACAAELKGTSRYTEGMRGFCPNAPRSGGLYCGRHKHLEEGAVAEELRDIPVAGPSETIIGYMKRTCKCDPATIVTIDSVGVQCACGAVWPLVEEPE